MPWKRGGRGPGGAPYCGLPLFWWCKQRPMVEIAARMMTNRVEEMLAGEGRTCERKPDREDCWCSCPARTASANMIRLRGDCAAYFGQSLVHWPQHQSTLLRTRWVWDQVRHFMFLGFHLLLLYYVGVFFFSTSLVLTKVGHDSCTIFFVRFCSPELPVELPLGLL